MFWIAQINIGARRLFFLLGSEIFFLLIAWLLHLTQAFNFIIGSLITLMITYLLAAHKYGIFIQRYVFTEHGERYEIKDYYKPMEPSKNYRILSRNNSKQTDSKIFLTKQTQWAYYDEIRIILQEQIIPKYAIVLILGGGGGALAKTILQTYPSSLIDVVEISKKMITQARRYFLLPQEFKSISLLCQDALLYITSTQKKYDIIILDLFINSEISKISIDKKSIELLTHLCTTRTILLINLSGTQETFFPKIIRYYKHAFPNFHIYLLRKSIPTLIVVHKLQHAPSFLAPISTIKQNHITIWGNKTLFFPKINESTLHTSLSNQK